MQHLFQVASLDEVPREQLEELVAEYPSFGVARYLLSRKLRSEGDGHFMEETLKTNLYFSNPYWLQWLLENNVEKPVAIEKTVEIGLEKEDHPVEMKHVAEEQAFAPYEQEEDVVNVEETLPSTTDMATDGSVAPEPAAPVLGASVRMTTDESVVPEPALPAPTVGGAAADDIMTSIAALRNQRKHEVNKEEEKQPETSHSLASMAMEQAEEETQTVVTEVGGIETEVVDNHHIEETKHVIEEVNNAGEALPTSADMATTELVAPEPAAPILEVPTLEFQAFHTIDYFASQGIKLSLDENPSDKLGKQMKSFTDWLKTMRKLPQKNQQPVPDIAAEHLVRASAAHSVEGKEVVTETMAEVLVKQGMREKATEVYRKLSLLNPDKSSYFANKIDQLKID